MPLAPLAEHPQPVPVLELAELEGAGLADPWVGRARVVALTVVAVVALVLAAVLAIADDGPTFLVPLPFALIACAALAVDR